jgi:hypothetical protein
MIMTELAADVRRWFENQTAGAFPAIPGSLSLRRAQRIRANCQACQSGEQHTSWVLYRRAKGRRLSVYMPKDLVAEVRRCLDKGRIADGTTLNPIPI